MQDYMGREYTPFEQNMALAWASGNFADWMRKNPNASVDDREKAFFDFVEGGLSLALEFRKQNA